MQELADMELLRRYAEQDSDEAFAALVTRHVNLVYSAALRTTANAHVAEEVSQAVFLILAKKARTLRNETILSGWLYQTARLTAANFVRGEIRRTQREQEAYMQSLSDESESNAWPQIAPHLEDAMGQLSAKDRNALLLRFFEGKSFQEVGVAFGHSENAAKKRVNRALEKLRKCFLKRGVVSTAAILAGVVSANSVQAAPVALAASISATAIAKGTLASASTLTLVNGALKIMAWAKVKTALAVGAVLLTVGTVTVVSSNLNSPQREAKQILERMRDTYASLSSYNSSGQTIQESVGRVPYTLTCNFTMRLGRPNFYLIEYEQNGSSYTNKGAVWSNGNGDYFANDVVGKTNKSPIAGNYLDDIADVTGGVTAVVPGSFFETPIPDSSATGGVNELLRTPLWKKAPLVKETDEKVGAVDCHVVSAETERGKALLWIGKKDSLVYKSQQRVKLMRSKATDAEVYKMLEGSQGPAPLPMKEIKRRIDEGRRTADATMKPVTVVFSEEKDVPGVKSMTIEPPAFTILTQTHEGIRMNEPFFPTDFTR